MKTFRKISNLYGKVAVWGVRGIIEYFVRLVRKDPLSRFFKENAQQYPYPFPEKGITIIGPLTRCASSTSHVLRDFAFSLKDAGIPFQTFDTGGKEMPVSDTDGILTNVSDFRIQRYSHVVEMFSPSPLPDHIVPHRAQIVFWEFNEGLCDAFHALSERDDSIIAMSDFNFQYFKQEFSGIRDVFKILYPLRMDVSNVLNQHDSREKFGLAPDEFLVFYNFNYASGLMRKNPLGAILAFSKALPLFKGEAKLVMKTTNAHRCKELESQLLSFADELGVRKHLVLFNDWMTQSDIYDLTNACDVYLSLNRGEGFGLGIAEAMCLAKAVVCTDYGAPTEFCSAGHAIPIPFRLVNMSAEEHASHWWYRGVRKWAEPDVDAAAEALVKLQSDESIRTQLGLAAQDYIRSKYSIGHFRESVLAFLYTNSNG